MNLNQSINDKKLKVFVSYSRKDLAFAQKIVAALEARGITTKIDTRDLPKFEDWRRELLGFIQSADAIVFIVSPHSISSAVCCWELEQVAKLNKRLAPVVLKRVSDDKIPSAIAKINYLFFDDARSFNAEADALALALQSDIGWLKEHTQLGERARRWDERRRSSALCLRGQELRDAERWIGTIPPGAPQPTDLQRLLIAKSRRAVATRRSWIVAGFLVLVVLGIGWWRQSWVREQYQWTANMRPHVQTLSQEQNLAQHPGRTFSECDAGCPEMVVIPAGKFVMGSSDTESNHETDEGPQHEVSIPKPFAVSKFTVTFSQWDMCVASGVCPDVSDSNWGRKDRPAINIKWEDAKLYVNWLSRNTGKSYRLLSEAEWEYAARSGKTTLYFWGDAVGKGNANCKDCGTQWDGKLTAPVGSFKPNDFGLYDMLGNVWQWCEDDYHPSYDKKPEELKSTGGAWTIANGTTHVLRGGSYALSSRYARLANRGRYGPPDDFYNDGFGFRIARNLI